MADSFQLPWPWTRLLLRGLKTNLGVQCTISRKTFAGQHTIFRLACFLTLDEWFVHPSLFRTSAWKWHPLVSSKTNSGWLPKKHMCHAGSGRPCVAHPFPARPLERGPDPIFNKLTDSPAGRPALNWIELNCKGFYFIFVSLHTRARTSVACLQPSHARPWGPRGAERENKLYTSVPIIHPTLKSWNSMHPAGGCYFQVDYWHPN